MKYVLIRDKDQLKKQANNALWIEWDESGSFQSIQREIREGRSLLLSPEVIGWLTTPVVDIVIDTPMYKRFWTKNSLYELYIDIDEKDSKELNELLKIRQYNIGEG